MALAVRFLTGRRPSRPARPFRSRNFYKKWSYSMKRTCSSGRTCRPRTSLEDFHGAYGAQKIRVRHVRDSTCSVGRRHGVRGRGREREFEGVRTGRLQVGCRMLTAGAKTEDCDVCFVVIRGGYIDRTGRSLEAWRLQEGVLPRCGTG